LYITALPLDLEIRFYHMMSSIVQLQQKHVEHHTSDMKLIPKLNTGAATA